MSIIRSWRTFLAAVLLVVAEGAAAAQGDAGTELLKAAGDGDVLRIKALLADGAPLEARDEDGNTPLLRATLGNHEVAASVLMKAGADVNAKNRIEDSAYLYAGARGYNEILTLTLRHGADIRSTNRYGGTALIPACERGLAETARLLLRAGVNPNHVNKLGWTALLEAIILGDGGPKYQATVLELLSFGTNPDVADRTGAAPVACPRARPGRHRRHAARRWRALTALINGAAERAAEHSGAHAGVARNSGQPAAQPMQAREGQRHPRPGQRQRHGRAERQPRRRRQQQPQQAVIAQAEQRAGPAQAVAVASQRRPQQVGDGHAVAGEDGQRGHGPPEAGHGREPDRQSLRRHADRHAAQAQRHPPRGPCEAGRRRFHSAPRVPASATAMPIQPNPSHGSGPVMKGPAA